MLPPLFILLGNCAHDPGQIRRSCWVLEVHFLSQAFAALLTASSWPEGKLSTDLQKTRHRRFCEVVFFCGSCSIAHCASEAAQDNAKPTSRGAAHHGRSASGAPIPISNQRMAILRHLLVAERASGAAERTPGSREHTQSKPTLTRIADSKRIRASGTATANNLDGGQPESKQPIQIGGKPIIIRERTRASNNQTEHTQHHQTRMRSGGKPRARGGRASCLPIQRSEGARSRAALAAEFTLDSVTHELRHPHQIPSKRPGKSPAEKPGTACRKKRSCLTIRPGRVASADEHRARQGPSGPRSFSGG